MSYKPAAPRSFAPGAPVTQLLVDTATLVPTSPPRSDVLSGSPVATVKSTRHSRGSINALAARWVAARANALQPFDPALRPRLRRRWESMMTLQRNGGQLIRPAHGGAR